MPPTWLTVAAWVSPAAATCWAIWHMGHHLTRRAALWDAIRDETADDPTSARGAPAVEVRCERREDCDQRDRPEQRRRDRVLHRPRVDRRRGIRVLPQRPARGGDRAHGVPLGDHAEDGRHAVRRYEGVGDE